MNADQTPATAAGRALVLRLASPDPLGPRSYAEDILEIEREARALDRDALAEVLPFIRHRATCLLNAVRDNPPDDESCTCGLREFWTAHAAPVEPHQPGDFHRYPLICEVCGQRGQIVVSLEPQRALLAREAPAASPEASDEH